MIVEEVQVRDGSRERGVVWLKAITRRSRRSPHP